MKDWPAPPHIAIPQLSLDLDDSQSTAQRQTNTDGSLGGSLPASRGFAGASREAAAPAQRHLGTAKHQTSGTGAAAMGALPVVQLPSSTAASEPTPRTAKRTAGAADDERGAPPKRQHVISARQAMAPNEPQAQRPPIHIASVVSPQTGNLSPLHRGLPQQSQPAAAAATAAAPAALSPKATADVGVSRRSSPRLKTRQESIARSPSHRPTASGLQSSANNLATRSQAADQGRAVGRSKPAAPKVLRSQRTDGF